MISPRKTIVLALIVITAITSASNVIAAQNIDAAKKVLPIILEMMNPAPLMDYDNDGLTNAKELELGLNYNAADTDGDGLNDGFEVKYAFNPHLNQNINNIDSDNDGLTTLEEQAFDGDPNTADADTDHDGRVEIADNCAHWSNQNQADTNNDGIGDACQAGDINRDGKITAADVNILQTALNTSSGIAALPLNALELCDTSGDGLCTADDIASLMQYIAGDRTGIRINGPTNSEIWSKVLTRLGYGPDSWTMSRLKLLQTTAPNNTAYYAINNYILEQLNPKNIDDSIFLEKLLPHTYNAPAANNGLAVYGKSFAQLAADFNFSADAKNDSPARISAVLAEGKYLRSIYSHRQLEAILADFWLNHFNVNATDGNAAWSIVDYENVIRELMFGQFETLLTATAKHPAMLDYLNLGTSTKTSLNENFAREVLELHSVGPGTPPDNLHYDHDTGILPVAKVLTGFQIDYSNANRPYKFFPNAHFTDPNGVKITIAGSTWTFGGSSPTTCGNLLASTGENEGNTLFCLLARHEKTAELVSTKLIKRFLGDTAANNTAIKTALLTTLKTEWQSGNGNLKSIYTALLTSDAFKASLYYDAKTAKRPQVIAASMARALGDGAEGSSDLIGKTISGIDSSTSAHFKGLRSYLDLTGEKPYQAGPPTGYSENASAWTNVSNYLQHLRYAEKLISTSINNSNYQHYSSSANYFPVAAATTEQIIADVFAKLYIDRNAGHINTQLYAYTMSTPLRESQEIIVPIRGIFATPKFMSN